MPLFKMNMLSLSTGSSTLKDSLFLPKMEYYREDKTKKSAKRGISEIVVIGLREAKLLYNNRVNQELEAAGLDDDVQKDYLRKVYGGEQEIDSELPNKEEIVQAETFVESNLMAIIANLGRLCEQQNLQQLTIYDGARLAKILEDSILKRLPVSLLQISDMLELVHTYFEEMLQTESYGLDWIKLVKEGENIILQISHREVPDPVVLGRARVLIE